MVARSSWPRVFRLHADVHKKGIKITRIFLVPEVLQTSLRETFEQHAEFGIHSFALSPDDVDDTLCRDFIIFDEDLLRSGAPLGSDTDRKKAVSSTIPLKSHKHYSTSGGCMR
jgi:hypothetical protein